MTVAIQGLLPGIDFARCRGCRRFRAVKSRRWALCRACYDAASRGGRIARKDADAPRGRLREATPTPARPGTPEKVAALAARYAAGEQLWHPGDAR